MSSAFDDIPEFERNILVERYLGRWRGKVPPSAASDAREYVKDNLVYMLRMFWQARYDKIDDESKQLFDWVSTNLLPNDAKYAGLRYHRLLIEHSDHNGLASQVFDDLWDRYEADPNSGFVCEARPTLANRFLELFRR